MLLLYLLALSDPVNGDLLLELIDKHSNRLKSYVYGKTHNHENAGEIVQDVFFKVYRYLDKFRDLPDDDIKRLLISYTKSSLADFFRRSKKSVGTVDGYYDDDGNVIEIPDTTLSPENIVISEDACRRVAEFIEKLPAAQREVMIYKYKYHHTDSEIAKLLGISEQAVSSRANRARDGLRKMIGGVVV